MFEITGIMLRKTGIVTVPNGPERKGRSCFIL